MPFLFRLLRKGYRGRMSRMTDFKFVTKIHFPYLCQNIRNCSSPQSFVTLIPWPFVTSSTMTWMRTERGFDVWGVSLSEDTEHGRTNRPTDQLSTGCTVYWPLCLSSRCSTPPWGSPVRRGPTWWSGCSSTRPPRRWTRSSGTCARPEGRILITSCQ